MDAFKEYAEELSPIIFYRIDGNEVTLFAGRCCFKDNVEDKELVKLTKWLKERRAREVVEDLATERVFTK
mgnify:CR=1 FL=1